MVRKMVPIVPQILSATPRCSSGKKIVIIATDPGKITAAPMP